MANEKLKKVDTPFTTNKSDPISNVSAYERKGKAPAPLVVFGNGNVTALAEGYVNNPSSLKRQVDRIKEDTESTIVQNTAKSVSQRLSSLLGGNASILGSLAPAAVELLTSKLTKERFNTNYTFNNSLIRSTVNDYNTTSDYVKTMGAALENPISLIDNQAEESLYGGLIDQSIKMDNIGAIGPLLGKITNTAIRAKVENRSINTAFDSMKLDAIQTLITAVGPDRVNQVRPSGTYDIFSNFSIPTGSSLSKADQAANLTSVAGQLEPMWHTSLRLNDEGIYEEVDDLTYYQSASPEALDVLTYDDAHRTNATIAKDFPIESTFDAQKKAYPYTLKL